MGRPNRSGIDWSNQEEIREYRREYLQEWQRKHSGYHKEYQRNWRKQNPEYYKELMRERYRKHPEHKRECDGKYRQRNPKKIKVRNLINHHPEKYPLGLECEFCGATDKLQHGHIDYDLPEIYVTVCQPCNYWMDIGE